MQRHLLALWIYHTMNIKMNNIFSRSFLILVIVILSEVVVTFSSPSSDVENLLKFKNSLENIGNQLLDWNSSNPLCNGSPTSQWQGVICEGENVWGLKLEDMGLKGTINVDALKELSKLRTISLMDNNFEGPFPEFKKLSYLKTIFLSNNHFEGAIPDDAFDGMQSLKKIHLANNNLTGHIPHSLTTLVKLIELHFENNQFFGKIPNFDMDRLKVFNVSNNKLRGSIPSTFSHMDASLFSGNEELCGPPLDQCKSYNAVANISTATKIILGIVVVVAVAAIIVVIVIQLKHKQSVASIEKGDIKSSQNNKKVVPPNNVTKLSFLRDDDMTKFDMNDLMKSPAEELGNGILGSTYKASIKGKLVVVVKRYKEMNNVDKEEFHEHMRRLGRLNHVNLIPLVAFSYRKHEKILVTDYIDGLSLAVCLHGLDWPSRLKIIKGIARGLKYLYNELPSLVSPHGHLKASNIILPPSSFQPILTDFGLLPVLDPEHAQQNTIAYKSPEFKHARRITKKTDVWSFGILMLEILTGKLPKGKNNSMDITTWVKTFVKNDELGIEVFDKDMEGTKGCEEDIINMFKIALKCCEVDVDRRWDINEVVKNIEKIKEKDTIGDGFIYSTDDVGFLRELSIKSEI